MRRKNILVLGVEVCLMGTISAIAQQHSGAAASAAAMRPGQIRAEAASLLPRSAPEAPATAPATAAGNVASSGASQAVVPQLIEFSGTLQNLAGKAITGPADVTFSLYTEEGGGMPLWFETQTVQADSLGTP